ncbi:MAG: hypothetical protein AB8B65_15060 [Kordia sp.]|uniref:hypothetical protein n=1 Tax=Kordia sp. TaxID=1965332 RepID=UPI00385D9654
MALNRDDFTKKTVDLLAKRVGYLCSNPDCRKPTVGPNSDKLKATIIGIGAHITAASEGGPRYDETLTSEQRKDIDNGIWLCANCATLIDKDPIGFPLEMLNRWKSVSEDLINKELSSFKLKEERQSLEVDLVLKNNNSEGVFEPIFIEEVTNFSDKKVLKQLNKKFGFDYKGVVDSMKTGNLLNDHFLNKINSFDDFLDSLNGDSLDKYSTTKEEKNDPQPVSFSSLILNGYKLVNLSVCLLELELKNNSKEVLEDYKVYFDFENMLNAEALDKRKEFLDIKPYNYNIKFKDDFKAEFIPESSMLVQGDSIEIDKICFKTSHIKTISYVNWKVVARNFTTSGKLQININPIIEVEEKDKFVDNPENFNTLREIVCKYKFE